MQLSSLEATAASVWGGNATAVMNMGSLVSRNGPSPQAFMVVPIVGAFFIDIANLIVLQAYISFIQ